VAPESLVVEGAPEPLTEQTISGPIVNESFILMNSFGKTSTEKWLILHLKFLLSLKDGNFANRFIV